MGGKRSSVILVSPATAKPQVKRNPMQNHLQRQQTPLPSNDERLRLFTDNTRDVFWLTDVTISRLIYVSPSYETVWGQSSEILYRNPHSRLEAIDPQDR